MIENDTLVEIKTVFTNYFINCVTKIQIYAYLYILGITKAKLVESIKEKRAGEEDKKDTNVIEFDFSIPYWKAYCSRDS